MGLLSHKRLLHRKGNRQQNNKTTYQTGEDICKSKRLIPKIYKELIQLTIKIWLNNEHRSWRDIFSPKKTNRQQSCEKLLNIAAAVKLLQSCPTLCDPIDGSPPGSPVPGILQARTLEWVAISFSKAWKWKVKVKSLSHVRLDCSLPGSSTHGIFQARVLEWGAVAFSAEHC